MTAVSGWIQTKAAGAPNPAQVQNTLEQMRKSWPEEAVPLPEVIEQFPLGEASLLHLISVSSICAARLIRHPEILLWLRRPEICSEPRAPGEMLAALHRSAGDSIASENFRALRFWKGKEMLRIALREVTEAASLEETTRELSLLAEICLREVYLHWTTELGHRRGSPATDFAVLGLGKLGGRELNHSSDIDVIFLYGEEGMVSANLTYHEWFNLLGAKIVETFAAPSPDGALFRIDLRLRPEGTAGPLARSLESMENYYAGFGETWERLALIKARGHLRQPRTRLRISPPAPALHLPQKSDPRFARRDRGDQTTNRARHRGTRENRARRQARAPAAFVRSSLSCRLFSFCMGRGTLFCRKQTR